MVFTSFTVKHPQLSVDSDHDGVNVYPGPRLLKCHSHQHQSHTNDTETFSESSKILDMRLDNMQTTNIRQLMLTIVQHYII